MGSPIATNLVGAFKRLPQSILEGVVGQPMGHKVEGMFSGMPNVPVVPQATADRMNNAVEHAKQTAGQKLMQMVKPLGK